MAQKAKNMKMNLEYLNSRGQACICKGFEKQKWVLFCEKLISIGFTVYLYEAKKTFSKYVTITDGVKSFKVRFSNHKPIKTRETNGDCDFFVGVTNTGVRTTREAYFAALSFFEVE